MGKGLAINAGSSSLKFQLFDMPEETGLAKGLMERIGFDGSEFTLEYNETAEVFKQDMHDHGDAVELVLKEFLASRVIESLDEIIAVGHLVVNVGELFSKLVI